jgi:hypothetical protein
VKKSQMSAKTMGSKMPKGPKGKALAGPATSLKK